MREKQKISERVTQTRETEIGRAEVEGQMRREKINASKVMTLPSQPTDRSTLILP